MSGKIEALQLFNEKAQRLFELSFTQIMFSRRTGVDFDYEAGKGLEVSRRGPDRESIEAISLTLRFFMQDGESCSIRNVSKIYERLPISHELKELFNQARTSLNTYLDTHSLMKIVINLESLTNRDILNTFMYGGLAHSSHKERFDAWMSSPIAPLFINEYCAIVAEMVRIINYIVAFNKRVIEELEE